MEKRTRQGTSVGSRAEPRDLLRLLDEGATAERFEALLADPSPDTAERQRLREDVELGLRLRAQLEWYAQRERELRALYQTARDLTALREVDDVLRAIVQRARQLIGTDIGHLSAVDAERGDFYVRATQGSVTETFSRLRVPRGVGVCGYVAERQRPYYSSDYLSDDRFPHDDLVDEAVKGEGLVSILGVPLLVNRRVTGVLFVANRFARSFSSHEMALLVSLADLAALAVDNARLLEDTQLALRREHEANSQLHLKTAEVQAAAHAHEQLTSVVANGGGLADVAALISTELSGRILVLDDKDDVIAAAGETTARSSHVEEDVTRAVQESQRSGRSVAVSRGGHEVGRVISVEASTGQLGALLLWPVHVLSETQVRTFERSALVIAVVLLSHERVALAERAAMNELVKGLLKTPQDDVSVLVARAGRSGVDLRQPTTLMLLDLQGVHAGQARQLARSTLEGHSALVGEHADDLVILAPSSDTPDLTATLQRTLAGADGHGVTVAVANPVDISDLPGAYQRARQCLDLLMRLGRQGTVGQESELGLYSLLFSAYGQAELESYVRSTIGPLVDHDERRRSELARTLLEYLDAARNTKVAAKALHIHVNTLRQRLETAERILDGWKDPSRQLEIHVALRLHRLRQTATLRNPRLEADPSPSPPPGV